MSPQCTFYSISRNYSSKGKLPEKMRHCNNDCQSLFKLGFDMATMYAKIKKTSCFFSASLIYRQP